MGIKLETIVPWGRSLSEYIAMFNLTATDLSRKILDCGAGPASFNAEMTRQGYTVTSCDPIYQFSTDEISQRIQATYPQIINGVTASRDSYIWDAIASPEQLGEVRMAAMNQFLQDFPMGFAAGRYLTAELPHLLFSNQQFDLALCSHLLFTYSDQLSTEFHIQAIAELCRVATEVRIFPILDISGATSPHLQPVLDHFQQQGHQTEIQLVSYEFQKGGNQLLKISQPYQSANCHSPTQAKPRV
ncbi:SAM-dependent methyltransferase [Trichocoleus desertorum]|uniref:SAM-dependent methyltransferase n=1 Tax=Trichocoleus desertorum GB2-A4 TaxID=2933944 RepID=A0ABV0J5H9_9CYAN|nr:SAM-dependent methyltransferase [Trichocoleus sp. FACHB-46]